ncbi:MAG TPA: type III pantothenate kinase [Erysipelotrichaceae bacterium]|nr:type III pantothenate kinase [Erysipelotrichaceae bacterium]
MILTVDVGNSNLVAVIYDLNKQRIYDERLETQKENVVNYYKQWLDQLFSKKVDRETLTGVVLSSVVPAITDDLVHLLMEYTALDIYVVSASKLRDFKIHLKERDHIGADFIATSYGTMAKYPLPAIVADLGSATKISVINQHKEFKGGVIVPGIGISSDALVRFIPHLPAVDLTLPTHVIGSDTIEAMQSGVLYGAIATVEGLADKIEKELGLPVTRLITGGYAKIIYHAMPDFTYDEFLLSEGLYEIFIKEKE